MQNILWSGLNLMVLGGLLYIFYRAAKLIWQHIGRGAALVFGLALLLLGSRQGSAILPTGQHNLLAGIPAGTPLGNASSTCQFAAGKGTALALLAEYHAQEGQVRPRGLFLTTAKSLLGHTYEPLAGRLTQQGQQLRYEVWVLHHWNLFGGTFYQNDEHYVGLMPISAPL
jgi:hypothetical protein